MNKQQIIKKYKDALVNVSKLSDSSERSMRTHRKNSKQFKELEMEFQKHHFGVIILEMVISDLEKLQ
jgi:hypothetical protein